MKSNRIIVALLIASWTINVALGVALFLKNQYPEGAYFNGGEFNRPSIERKFSKRGSRFHKMRDKRDEFRKCVSPLMQKRQEFMSELISELSKDELDTARMSMLSDSLTGCIIGLKGEMLSHMIKMHDTLPPHERRQLMPRFLRHMDSDGGGFMPPPPPPEDSLKDLQNKEPLEDYYKLNQ